jgi:hypothetical protein
LNLIPSIEEPFFIHPCKPNDRFLDHTSNHHRPDMATSVSAVPSEGVSGPSSSLPPLADLVKRSTKRTRAVYGNEQFGIDDGLAKA